MTRGKLSLSNLGVVITALLIFSFCGNTKAEGADWALYAESNNFSFYFDSSGTKISVKDFFSLPWTKIAKTWIKRSIKNEQAKNWQIQENKKLGLTARGYENYEYTISLVEINCSDKSRRTLMETDYNKGGSVLAASEEPYARWKPVTPESAYELLHKVLCAEPNTRQDEETEAADKQPPVKPTEQQ